MSQTKRIAVAALDWGLGHATRCMPVIRALLDCKQEVLLVSSGAALRLLRQEFPDLPHAEIQAYDIQYPLKKSMASSLIRQAPGMLRSIRQEHRELQKIMASYRPHAVISDSRFGLWCREIPTVFITHQLHLQFPPHLKWAGFLANRLNHYFISRFDECWIPDYETHPGLSGNLSHPPLKNVKTRYLGPLSRFHDSAQVYQNYDYDVAVVLSGPEPQRTILEEKILDQLPKLHTKTLVVRGLPGLMQDALDNKSVRMVSHLPSSALRDALLSSRLIVSRSGYSSIMDYLVLGKNAVLVPTPGQTEQEYLAHYYKDQKIFFSAEQKDFNLADALSKSREYSIKNLPLEPTENLKSYIENWLKTSLC